MDVSRKFQGCVKDVSGRFQGCFQKVWVCFTVVRMFHGQLKGVLSEFYGCVKVVSKKLTKCFKEVSKVYKGSF